MSTYSKFIPQWNRPATDGSAPYAICAHSTTYSDGKFYVFGGWNGVSMTNDLYELDPDTMIWTKPVITGNAPRARGGHSCTMIPPTVQMLSSVRGKPGSLGKLILLGGGDGENYLNDVHLFDLDTMHWKTLYTAGNSPSPRSRHTATLVNNTLVVFGGGGGDGTHIFNDIYTLDLTTMLWNKPNVKGTPPTQRWGHTSSYANPYIYIFGGYDGTKMLNDVHMLNIETMSWETPKNIRNDSGPSPRAGHASCLVTVGKELKILVFGGGDGDLVFNDTYLFDIESLTWFRPNIRGYLPAARCAHTCNVKDGKIFVFGGSDVSRRFKDVYTLESQVLQKLEEPLIRSRNSKINLISPNSKTSSPRHSTEFASVDEIASEVDLYNVQDEKKNWKRNSAKVPMDLSAWLSSVGLEKYIDNFLKEEIDMSIVHYLTEENLIDLGIDKLGARLKFLHAVKQLPTYKMLNANIHQQKNTSSLSNEILVTNIKYMKDLSKTTDQLVSALIHMGNSISEITNSAKNRTKTAFP